jgi:hypothetical protein
VDLFKFLFAAEAGGEAMSFDPSQAGFAWPTEVVLTNASGEQMTVQPHSANLTSIQGANGRRVGECYRYYATDGGILTELEVGHWLAGGEAECQRLCTAVKELLSPGQPHSFASLIDALHKRGFAQVTILVNIRWLIQDGYVSTTFNDGVWSISNERL